MRSLQISLRLLILIVLLFGEGGRLFAVHFFFVEAAKKIMADPVAASKLDEYRGSNHWKGLIPAVDGTAREWDEGFRAFLLK